MTDSPLSDEQFLGRLREADPVDRATLPGPDDPRAVHLLDSILADAGSAGSAPPSGPSRFGDHSATAVPEPVGSRRVGWIGRGRGALLAVAAAVLVVVGAAVVLAPDGTPAAVAEVRAAAANTAEADTGHIETTFALHFDDEGAGLVEEGEEDLTGRAAVDYAGSDLALSVQLDSLPLGMEDGDLVGLPELADIRLVDDVAYFRQGGQWQAVETGGLLGDLVVQFVDPRTVLDTVQGLTETTEVGSADLDGTSTTHYRSVIDLGDESLAQAGWLAIEGMDVQADGEVTLDLFVDGDGVLRRFELTGEIRPEEAEPGRGTFEVVTSFSQIGDDLVIEAPAGATVFDPFGSLEGHIDADVDGAEVDGVEVEGD